MTYLIWLGTAIAVAHESRAATHRAGACPSNSQDKVS